MEAKIGKSTKLPVKFKKEWVKALRSGKYKQGRCSLHNVDKDTYCCLGVACSILKVDSEFILSNNSDSTAMLRLDAAPSALRNLKIFKELIKMNDREDKPLTFKEIANYISKTL